MLRTYLKLFRFPNAFTAVADVLLGYFVTHDSPENWPPLVLLIVASVSIYSAGMALNDYFDREVDLRERPHRPIPSGRIAAAQARLVSGQLLIIGAVAAIAATIVTRDPRAAVVGMALIAMVVAYDGWLKNTLLSPIAMGGCRFLNVLLGMSVNGPTFLPMNLMIAGGLGVYVAGITIYARQEAGVSARGRLVLGMATMAAGIAILAFFPQATDSIELAPFRPEFAVQNQSVWYAVWMLLGANILWRCSRAVINPAPNLVQQGVKYSLLSLIILDAMACAAVQPKFAIAIAVLLVPAWIVGMWVYST